MRKELKEVMKDSIDLLVLTMLSKTPELVIENFKDAEKQIMGELLEFKTDDEGARYILSAMLEGAKLGVFQYPVKKFDATKAAEVILDGKILTSVIETFKEKLDDLELTEVLAYAVEKFSDASAFRKPGFCYTSPAPSKLVKQAIEINELWTRIAMPAESFKIACLRIGIVLDCYALDNSNKNGLPPLDKSTLFK